MVLNEAFKNLELQPGNKGGALILEKVLVGKVLTTQMFRRFTIYEIVEKNMAIASKGTSR